MYFVGYRKVNRVFPVFLGFLRAEGGRSVQLSVIEIVGIALLKVFAELDAGFERPRHELESRPDYPGAWSVAEHLEHVVLANHFLLLTIGKGCRKALKRAAVEPIPEAGSDLTPLAAIASPGVFDWQPPAHMLPGGRRPLEELREELRGERDMCLRHLAEMPAGEGRLCRIGMSVNRLGKLDMYQWLYFLAQHARFHLNFIERNRRGQM